MTTNGEGRFTTPSAMYGGCMTDDVHHTICVDHPEFESYDLVLEHEDLHSKFVNITLVRRQ